MGNQSCKIDNGEGEKTWWPWSECKLKTCNSGYENTSGKCTASLPTGSCTLNPSYPGEKSYSYDETGTCIVDSCDTGYVLKNGECMKDTKVEESPKPITVPGWNQASLLNFQIFDTMKDTPVGNSYTLESCAAYAKTKGGDAFTFRPSTQGLPAAANTCIGIGYMPDGYTLVGDMIGPTDGITGCVDPAKTWPKCGTSVSWCYKYDGTGIPLESDGSWYAFGGVTNNGSIGRTTLNDLKTAWNSPGYLKVDGHTDDLKTEGYKYVAVTIADGNDVTVNDTNYYVYLAWGKTLPIGASLYPEGCSYGGTSTSSTQYKVGRKPDSYIAMRKKTTPSDTWGGTTWMIYDLTKVDGTGTGTGTGGADQRQGRFRN